MDFEGLAELLVPLFFLAIVGGLVALRMLKPYGKGILELIREIQEERHQALAETRDMQAVRDRLDMLAERQDFLEALIRGRLDEEEQAEIERMRRQELGVGSPPAGRQPGSGREEGRGERRGVGTADADGAVDADRGDGPGDPTG